MKKLVIIFFAAILSLSSTSQAQTRLAISFNCDGACEQAIERTDFKGNYWRLELPEQNNAISVGEGESFFNKLVRLFWRNNDLLMVSTVVTLQDKPGPEVPIIVIHKENGNPRNALDDLPRIAVTPFVYDTNLSDIRLTVRLRWKKTVESSVVTTLVGLLKTAASLNLTPMSVASTMNPLQPQINDASKSADDIIGRLFSAQDYAQTQVRLPIAKLKSVSLTLTNDDNMTVTQPILVSCRESVISRDGTKSKYQEPEEILASGKSSGLVGASWFDLMENSRLPKLDGSGGPKAWRDYCKKTEVELAEIGLNRRDRFAVLFSGLVYYEWNSSWNSRMNASEGSTCFTDVTAGLSDTNLRSAVVPDDIIQQSQSSRTISGPFADRASILFKSAGKGQQQIPQILRNSVMVVSQFDQGPLTEGDWMLKKDVPIIFSSADFLDLFQGTDVLTYQQRRACFRAISGSSTKVLNYFCLQMRNGTRLENIGAKLTLTEPTDSAVSIPLITRIDFYQP